MVRFAFLCTSGVRPWDSLDFWLSNLLEQLWHNCSFFWGREKFLAKKRSCLDIGCIILKIRPRNKCVQERAWTSAIIFFKGREHIQTILFNIYPKMKRQWSFFHQRAHKYPISSPHTDGRPWHIAFRSFLNEDEQ